MAGTRTMGTRLEKVKAKDETANLVIGKLTSIGEIGVESDEQDTTTLDTEGGYKEFIATTKDAGEVAIAGNIVKADEKGPIAKLLALAENQTMQEWIVTYPSGAKWQFKGFIKSFKDGEKTVDGLATFSATIRVSGKPTFTPTEPDTL